MSAFVTGSRRGDLALFVLLALLVVGLCDRLRVYYKAPRLPSAASHSAESSR